jgi:hypothetical protein
MAGRIKANHLNHGTVSNVLLQGTLPQFLLGLEFAAARARGAVGGRSMPNHGGLFVLCVLPLFLWDLTLWTNAMFGGSAAR